MENKRKTAFAGVPLWLVIVLCGVIIAMTVAIAFLVLLHLDIIRCVPVDQPIAEATPSPEPTIAPTAAMSFMSPPPTTPRRQNGRNNPPAIASPSAESESPASPPSMMADPKPSAIAPSVSQFGILLSLISP